MSQIEAVETRGVPEKKLLATEWNGTCAQFSIRHVILHNLKKFQIKITVIINKYIKNMSNLAQ
jgi:hypothetical protein